MENWEVVEVRNAEELASVVAPGRWITFPPGTGTILLGGVAAVDGRGREV